MCHPCWLNIKRSTLDWYAHFRVGATYRLLDTFGFLREADERAKVLVRQEDEHGVILVIDMTSRFANGVRMLWCPKHGGGGWVDKTKMSQTLKDLWELGEGIAKAQAQEAAADNCMALLMEVFICAGCGLPENGVNDEGDSCHCTQEGEADNLMQLLAEADAKTANGNWIPACNRTEVPFRTRNGYRLLYCWQPSSGRHAYLNCDTDIILTDEEAKLAMGM